jgi:hypothetical protein
MKPNKDFPTVFTDDDGNHMVMNTDGSILRAILFTRVHDEVGQLPTVIIKCICNIAKDKDEAKKIYE